MQDAGRIGEYLKARRRLITPEEVGLPPGSRRRVPGLRREEVAMLSGISIDYYTRLEQGQERHPSPQVLGALARALRLDDDATAHLQGLISPGGASPRRARKRAERAPARMQHLLDSWPATPAYVQGRYLDILAVNQLAVALAPYYRVGVNLLRVVFLEEGYRDSFEDWDRTAHDIVAALRARIGPDSDDPALSELVGELSLRSETFRQLWARHDARVKRRGTTTVRHPLVGEMTLAFEKLPIPDAEGQILVVYHAAPGSPSASRLGVLAALSTNQ